MKQVDLERINRIVINPLSAVYGNFPSDMVEMLYEDLQQFDNSELEKAVVSVRRERTTQPKIAHIVQACREAKSLSTETPGNDAQDYLNALTMRSARARQKAGEELSIYLQEPLMQSAVSGGWDRELRRYAYETFWLQAQYAYDVQSPGFDSTAINPGYVPISRDLVKAFVQSCKEYGKRKSYFCNPDDSLISAWKSLSAKRGNTVNQQEEIEF